MSSNCMNLPWKIQIIVNSQNKNIDAQLAMNMLTKIDFNRPCNTNRDNGISSAWMLLSEISWREDNLLTNYMIGTAEGKDIWGHMPQ